MSSSHHDTVDLNLLDKKSFYIQAPKLQAAAAILFVLGLVALGAGFAFHEGARVWGSVIFNTFFFFCLGLGGMILSTCTDVISATWHRPIRRIQEAFGAFVPVASVIFLILIVCVAMNIGDAGSVYKWIKDPELVAEMWGKRSWLVPNFFYGRVVLYLLILSGIVCYQLSQTIKRDRLWMDGKKDEWETFSDEHRVKTRFWSGPTLAIFGVVFTFFAFDVTMSLAPKWLSTLWGGWSFAVMMQTLMAATLIAMFALRETVVGSYFKRLQFHDIGKLMHGFTVFFAYLTYAHVLTYWYGNMPEETEYFMERLHSPWVWGIYAVLFLGFIIPLYSLIPARAKWTAGWTLPIAGIILLAQWITNLILVMPEVIKPDQMKIPYVEVGGFFMVFGLFITTFLIFAKKVPMLPVGDPLLMDALNPGH
ncbi:MAG: hypothetical protein H7249_16660 [Chitinophagaceae bacterium]|nr:hypothetical protein [Oligoflexus sp.]